MACVPCHLHAGGPRTTDSQLKKKTAFWLHHQSSGKQHVQKAGSYKHTHTLYSQFEVMRSFSVPQHVSFPFLHRHYCICDCLMNLVDFRWASWQCMRSDFHHEFLTQLRHRLSLVSEAGNQTHLTIHSTWALDPKKNLLWCKIFVYGNKFRLNQHCALSVLDNTGSDSVLLFSPEWSFDKEPVLSLHGFYNYSKTI